MSKDGGWAPPLHNAPEQAWLLQSEREISRSTLKARLVRFLGLMLRSRTTWFGAVIVFILIGMAVLAPVVAPAPPLEPHPLVKLKPPSPQYLLGTDHIGRDVLSRIIYGARISLMVSITAVSVGLIAGVLLGLITGYYGGLVDSIVMRAMDGLLAFPAIILAIALMAAFGPSLHNAMLAIGIILVPSFARITRANVLSLKEKEFVEATRAMGASDTHILLKSILPNCLSPIIVQASLSVGYGVLFESELSFLGLGIQPPEPSWGSMLGYGRNYLEQAWWVGTFPGFAIFFTILALNFIGDGLREALDPRQSAT